MESNFVSDISDVLFNYYKNEEYQEIYDVIDASISDLNSSMNYDSAYRLQQDIAFLNTNMLTDISKYINTNAANHEGIGDKTKEDTIKEQSESSKINLTYKYFYLIVKLMVIIALLLLLYFKLLKSSDANPKVSLFGLKSNSLS